MEKSQQETENRLRQQSKALLDLAGNWGLYSGDLERSLDIIGGAPQLLRSLSRRKTIYAQDVDKDAQLAELAGSYLPERNIKALMVASITEHGKLSGWVSFSEPNRDREWYLDEVNFATSISESRDLPSAPPGRKTRPERRRS